MSTASERPGGSSSSSEDISTYSYVREHGRSRLHFCHCINASAHILWMMTFQLSFLCLTADAPQHLACTRKCEATAKEQDRQERGQRRRRQHTYTQAQACDEDENKNHEEEVMNVRTTMAREGYVRSVRKLA
eukprot:6176855-Pleurochrysis_carterae.AAC.1